jgi:hypothetical protein
MGSPLGEPLRTYEYAPRIALEDLWVAAVISLEDL